MMWKLTARQTICLSGAGAVAAHHLSWVDPVTVHIASNGGSDPSLPSDTQRCCCDHYF